MNTYKLEVKQVFTKIIEIEELSLDRALIKVNEMNNKNDFDLVNDNVVEIYTSIDFLTLEELKLNKEFNKFLYDKGKEVLSSLTIEDLSKFVYGNIQNAITNYIDK